MATEQSSQAKGSSWGHKGKQLGSGLWNLDLRLKLTVEVLGKKPLDLFGLSGLGGNNKKLQNPDSAEKPNRLHLGFWGGRCHGQATQAEV